MNFKISFKNQKNSFFEDISLNSLFALWQDLTPAEIKSLKTAQKRKGRNLNLFMNRLWSSYQQGSTAIQGQSLIKTIWDNQPPQHPRRSVKQLLNEVQRMTEWVMLEYSFHEKKEIRTRILSLVMTNRPSKKVFNYYIAQFERQVQKDGRSLQRLHDSWWINSQLYYQQGQDQYQRKQGIRMQEIDQGLDDFYWMAKIRNHVEAKIRNQIIYSADGTAKEMIIPEEWAEKSDYATTVQLYEQLIDFFDHWDSIRHFRQFGERLKKEVLNINEEDRSIFLKYVILRCNLWIEKGESSFTREIFDWTCWGIEQNAFIINKEISDDSYMNIASAAIFAKEYDKQLEYMLLLKPYLPKYTRELSFKTMLSYYYLHCHRYQEAIELLDTIYKKYKQPPIKYNLRAKSLRLRCYFMLLIKEGWDDPTAYKNAQRGLKAYLDSCPLQESRKLAYYNFIDFLHHLFKFQSIPYLSKKDKREEKSKFILKLENISPIISKQWLAEVIPLLK